MSSTQQVRAGAAYVELTTKDTAFIKGLNAAKKRLQDFGTASRMIGMSLFGAGAAASAPFAASAAVFASFEDAMLAVKGVTQASAEEFEKLSSKAKELGATTSFSATQVASLMTELGRAGFKPDQIIDMTRAVMDLARATGTDATLASGIMAATLHQFNLDATQATRVADGFTAAANKTFNSVESLGEAFQYAGPVAADAGMSLEETLAVLGTLGNVGIQGSEAGTAMRRLLTLSAAEAKKFAEVFGVATTDAVGNTRPLINVLSDVTDATKNLPTGQRMSKFNDAFGLLGITAASAIGKSVVDTRALYEELINLNGVAKATAQDMDSGIGGSFRIFLSAVEGGAIAIGEALKDPLKALTDVGSGALSGMIKWIEKNHQAVKTAALVTLGILGIGAALVVVGSGFIAAGSALAGVTAVFGVATGAITVIGSLMAALLSPLGLVLVAVGALGTYLITSTDIGTQALQWLGERFSILRSEAVQAWNAIAGALASGDIALAGKILWLTLKMEWQRGVNYLTGLWIGFKHSFLSLASEASFGAARLLTSATASLEVGWLETIDFLADAWSVFATTLMQTWNSTVGFIRQAWTRLKAMFDSDINVQAEVDRINQETTAKNDQATQSMLSTIGERDQSRRLKRSQIEQDRVGSQAALDQMQSQSEAKLQTKLDTELAGSQAELDEARRQWQEAITAAQKPPSEDAESKGPSGDPLKNAQRSLIASAPLLADQQRQIETKGGFNARGLQGIGADGLSERTAKASEQVAANTKQLVDQAKQSRLLFTA